MSTKTDSTSAVEPQSNKVSGVMASPATNSGQKLSNFATKSGFVIPKNKLSGSLVPIFRGAKKDGVGGGTTESNSKQMQRKTKWGPDLTQDVAVRKGRALALQIRVDQITQQLKSGKLSTGNTQDSPLVDENPDPSCSDPQIDIKKSESLQHEMREAIGEILKLDPSYKPPPGFKPLLKEASVPLPVKEYPGYNFIGLIYGPEGDNQKRLEKETGAKVQVQGTKADTEEKVDIKPGNSLQCTYGNMHVLVSADTFEKVDAAVSIIELLLSSVTGNLAAASTPHTSVSGENVNVLSQNQVGMPSNTIAVATENQAMQPVAGATQMPGHQLQYAGPWFSAAPSHTPVYASSGNIAHPNPLSLIRPLHFAQQTMNTPNVTLNFGAQPAPVVGFNPIIPNRPVVSPQAQPPRQILQHSQLTQASPSGHIWPPRHPSIVSVQPSSAETTASLPFPVTVSQPAPIGQLQTQVPISPSSIPDRPLTPLGVSSGQGGTSVGGTISLGVSNMGPMAPPPRPVSLHPQPDMAFKPPPSNISLTPFPPRQSGIPSGPMQPVPATNPNSSIHNLSGSSSFPTPGLSTSLPIPSSASGVTLYHNPVRPPVLTASGSGNFTFQPQQPNTNFQGVSRPNNQAAPQGGIRQQLSGPRPPSLPFAVPERPVNQIFPRQQVPNPVDQPHAHASSFPFGGRPGAISTPSVHTAFPYAGQPAPRSPVPQMGVRNFMPAPQMPNLPSPQFPRAGGIHVRQNYPPHKLLPDITLPSNQKFGNNLPMHPGNPAYPADQIYDPFSPSSVQPPQHKSEPMK